MITKDEMIPLLLEACPDLEPEWEAFVLEWRDDPEPLPLYLFLSIVARQFGALLASGAYDRLERAFAVVERWHFEGDAYVTEAASVGLLEDLQNTGLHDPGTSPQQFVRFLGPETRRGWTAVDDFWQHGPGTAEQ